MCKGPRQRTQEMMSLPSNRTQENPEPRYPGLHSGEEPPARLLAAKMFCCLPLPRGQRLRRAHRQSVWECGRRWLRAPPRGLWPFAQRIRKVTREPQARPGHLSHPTWEHCVLFLCVWMGVSRGVSATSNPRRMWVRSLWAGCGHTLGESRLGGMGRVQAALAAQADLTPSGGSPTTWVGV